MNNGINRRIPFLRYFPKSIKFYDIKNEKLAAGIFIVLLGINFCTSLLLSKFAGSIPIDSSQVIPEDIAVMFDYLMKIGSLSILSTLMMTIFSSFYVYAFIRDLRGIPYTLKECLKYTASKLIPVIIVSVIVSLSVSIGSMLLVIPGIILYIMFIFSVQCMLDQNKGIFNSLKSSVNLTKGFKMGIFNAVLLFNLLILIFPTFAESGTLVVPFVSAFISTIFNIVFQRFVTLIYYDLEYIRKPKNIDIDV
jgi:hypothetical protein